MGDGERPADLDAQIEALNERAQRLRKRAPQRQKMAPAAGRAEAPPPPSRDVNPTPAPERSGGPESVVPKRRVRIDLMALTWTAIILAVVLLLLNPAGTIRAEGVDRDAYAQFYQDIYIHGFSVHSDEPVPEDWNVHWWIDFGWNGPTPPWPLPLATFAAAGAVVGLFASPWLSGIVRSRTILSAGVLWFLAMVALNAGAYMFGRAWAPDYQNARFETSVAFWAANVLVGAAVCILVFTSWAEQRGAQRRVQGA